MNILEAFSVKREKSRLFTLGSQKRNFAQVRSWLAPGSLKIMHWIWNRNLEMFKIKNFFWAKLASYQLASNERRDRSFWSAERLSNALEYLKAGLSLENCSCRQQSISYGMRARVQQPISYIAEGKGFTDLLCTRKASKLFWQSEKATNHI